MSSVPHPAESPDDLPFELPPPRPPRPTTLPDEFPFEVLDLGNGQVFAWLRGPSDIPRIIAFARDSPDGFRYFFHGINVEDVISGRYQWFVEPSPGTEACATIGEVAVVPQPGTPGFSTVANAPLMELNLTVRQALAAGLVSLAPTYRHDYIHRLSKDRTRVFVWSPHRRVPPQPHRLTGDEWRDFLSSQGLPHYIPPTRVGPEFTPRKRPFRGSYQATRLCVAGGNYLWELGRDPTPMDLLYSTTGTTVAPVRGREYMFEELYPDTVEDDEASQFSLSSSPTAWGSSSTVASPVPSSQDSAYEYKGI
ncbi:hypothetical protein GGG16DRAFT_119373 [Schizophyllum commune]